MANGNGLFNDMLGNTLGVSEKDKFTHIKRDAFGKTLENKAGSQYNMFTGKPQIGGLGYAFLFRNYRPNLGKWQTAAPLGYPDGWNNLAYGNNRVTSGVDYQGTAWKLVSTSDTRDNNIYYTDEVLSTPTPTGWTGTFTSMSYSYYYSGITHTNEQFTTLTIRDAFYSTKKLTVIVRHYNEHGTLESTTYSSTYSDGPTGIYTRNYVFVNE